jgi:hypothetical protein
MEYVRFGVVWLVGSIMAAESSSLLPYCHLFSVPVFIPESSLFSMNLILLVLVSQAQRQSLSYISQNELLMALQRYERSCVLFQLVFFFFFCCCDL